MYSPMPHMAQSTHVPVSYLVLPLQPPIIAWNLLQKNTFQWKGHADEQNQAMHYCQSIKHAQNRLHEHNPEKSFFNQKSIQVIKDGTLCF
jgi:hypothetical protein